MMIKGVIFDFDGTLADTFPLIFLAFRTALLQFTGRSYSDEEITGYFGPSEDGIFQQIVPEHWHDAMAVYLAEYKKHHGGYVRLFPGVLELLKLLKDKQCKLAIVTGKGQETMDISLDCLGIRGYFDEMDAGSREKAIKDVKIRQVLKRWGIRSDEAIYVGDAVPDITFARAAGVIPVSVYWSEIANAGELRAENPEWLFGDVGEFQRWLLPQVPAVLL